MGNRSVHCYQSWNVGGVTLLVLHNYDSWVLNAMEGRVEVFEIRCLRIVARASVIDRIQK